MSSQVAHHKPPSALSGIRLAARGVAHYRPFYRLVAVAVAVAVMVVAGSLVVGSSVRGTLQRKVHERLGDTRTVVSSGTSYLDGRWVGDSLFGGKARGVLRTNGFVALSGRMVPVAVWGVDDRHIGASGAKVNPKLARELGLKPGEELALRLPAAGLVPQGSMFVTDRYTTALRLALQGVVAVEDGGNMALNNVQQTPLNIFLHRETLAEALDAAGKVNLIFSPEVLRSAQLTPRWTPAVSGVEAVQRGSFTEVVAERIFMPQQMVDAICESNPPCNRLFSYLVNSIAYGRSAVPYSFVTAIDAFAGQPLRGNEALLPDYTARRLGAKAGDTIALAYYVAGSGLKNLTEQQQRFVVKAIIPLSALTADATLSADFPGLSNVESCTSWSSDLPIDMAQIEREDEDFWEKHRATPKVLIAYEAGARLWRNDFGSATAVRVSSAAADLSGVTPAMAGVSVAHPREAALQAAASGVDFATLFLALGFFIIVGALLLVAMPIAQMLHARRSEVQLLHALGYSRRRIARLLLREAAPVIALAAAPGVALALAYAQVVLWLLSGAWRGAAHTDGISLHVNPAPVLASVAIVAALALLTVWLSLRKKEARRRTPAPTSRRRWRRLAAAATALTAALLPVNVALLASPEAYAATGLLFFASAVLWARFLSFRGKEKSRTFSRQKKIIALFQAEKSGALLSLLSLSLGVFLLYSVGLHRRGFADVAQRSSGTGGFTFWGESSAPVYHDLSTAQGRAQLGLKELPPGVEIVQLLRRQADEASCLNLHKPAVPTVLGVDFEALGRSTIGLAATRGGRQRAEVLRRQAVGADSAFPVLADATVIAWSLKKALGDTLAHRSATGAPVTLRLDGALANTIFQGALLMDRPLFAQLWGGGAGSEVMLVTCPRGAEQRVRTLLQKALYDYGLLLTPTPQRLAELHSVADTYLTIFMTLSALGLLTGAAAFVVAIRKQLAMRQREVALHRALGFSQRRIQSMLQREALAAPLAAIAVGAAGALLSLAGALPQVSRSVWLLALLVAAALVGSVVVFVTLSVKKLSQAAGF